jgi:hypothetical protein
MEEDFGRPKRGWRMLWKQALKIVCDGEERLLRLRHEPVVGCCGNKNNN